MPSFKELGDSFSNIEKAIKNGIVNIIPLTPNMKAPTYYKWGKYQQRKYPSNADELKEIKKYLIEENKVLKTRLKEKLSKDERKEIKDKIKLNKNEIKNGRILKKHRG